MDSKEKAKTSDTRKRLPKSLASLACEIRLRQTSHFGKRAARTAQFCLVARFARDIGKLRLCDIPPSPDYVGVGRDDRIRAARYMS